MPYRLRFTTAASLLCGMAAACPLAGAQSMAPGASASDDDDTVTVTATRLETTVDRAPASVTVITERRIEEELATDIKDLIRFEAGVSVRNSPTRFTAALSSTGRDGNSGFNIRGLEGNRVLFQVDGVRLPDAYAFGAQSVGRGDYVDLDLLKAVEIIRGPASALYGSDGVAGVVSFITRDPQDLLQDGRSVGLRTRTAYATADQSWANSAIVAGRIGGWSALGAFTRRDSREQDNQGTNKAPNQTRTAPNPTESVSDSILARLVFEPSPHHRFRLTYDHLDRAVDVEAFSGRSAAPPPFTATSVVDLDARDTAQRELMTLDHEFGFDTGVLRSGRWSLVAQESRSLQVAREDRLTAADRLRIATFDNAVWGASGQIEARLRGGGEHRVLLGGDISVTRQESLRNGIVPPVGESFPARAFPNTDYTLAGVFLQDEIALLQGQLVFTPAIRFDTYELTPERDPLYPASLPASGSEGDRWSPKIGVVAWPSDHVGAYANISTGYKTPAPSQVNNGFANPVFGYTSIANPDLRPETSESLEAGVRIRDFPLMGARLSGSLGAFAADYSDFIEQVQVSGAFTPANPALFQFVNLTEVSITGWEGRLTAVVERFTFDLSAALSDGEQRDGAQTAPLLSVDPIKVVAGLGYRARNDRFGGQLALTYSGGKDISTVPNGATPSLFRPPDFLVADLTAYWRLSHLVTARLGVFNLTDETYWWWGDVRGLADSSPIRDAFTQSGRNASLSVTLRY